VPIKPSLLTGNPIPALKCFEDTGFLGERTNRASIGDSEKGLPWSFVTDAPSFAGADVIESRLIHGSLRDHDTARASVEKKPQWTSTLNSHLQANAASAVGATQQVDKRKVTSFGSPSSS